MHGSLSIGNLLTIGGLLTIGCDPGNASQTVKFNVDVSLASNVTSVLADGAAAQIVPDGQGRKLSFTREYTDYISAMQGEPITFNFLAGDVIENTGQSIPGVCDRYCSLSDCPVKGDIISETI